MTAFILLALAARLQTAPVPTSNAGILVDAVARFSSASTNEQRFDTLTAMLTAKKLRFTVEPFSLERPLQREPRTEGRNVVVTLGDGSREFVIGAHYDAARLADGSLSKGAVDNAASSVILVHLAEMLAADKLPVRIRIVWFDMEEVGLVGSQQYLRKHATDTIAAMLNLDVNGYGKTILFGPSERADSASLRRTFLQTCALENIACVGFPQMPPGDDQPFVGAGIPTLSMGILPDLEVHQLWLMMSGNPNTGLAPGTMPGILRTIHTAGDTPDKVNGESMATVLRFAVSLIRSLGQR